MRFHITLKQPSDGLDPRIADTVATWIAAPPAGPLVDAGTLHAIANDVAAELVHPAVTIDGTRIVVDDQGERFTLEINPSGGTCAFEDPENERSVLEQICMRTGWVGYELERGTIFVGYDLVCTCESSIPSHANACGVCGALANDAALPRPARSAETPPTAAPRKSASSPVVRRRPPR